MSHMTTKPRLAQTKNDAGELVPSMNREGVQDQQVAGTVISINPKPISYIRKEDGEVREAYQGTADVNFGYGEEKAVSVLFASSSIDKIEQGSVYWMTCRKSDDGLRANLTCGGLGVINGLDASAADKLSAYLLSNAPAEIAATA